MICLAMLGEPSFDYMLVQYFLLQCWVHRLQQWALYNKRNATARKSSRKLLDTWISWGSPWILDI